MYAPCKKFKLQKRYEEKRKCKFRHSRQKMLTYCYSLGGAQDRQQKNSSYFKVFPAGLAMASGSFVRSLAFGCSIESSSVVKDWSVGRRRIVWGSGFPWNEMETVELSLAVCTDGSDAHGWLPRSCVFIPSPLLEFNRVFLKVPAIYTHTTEKSKSERKKGLFHSLFSTLMHVPSI